MTRTTTASSNAPLPRARLTLSPATDDLLRLGSYDGIKIMRVADLLTLLPTL